eukprot:4899970-Amphidinium_carterae.1
MPGVLLGFPSSFKENLNNKNDSSCAEHAIEVNIQRAVKRMCPTITMRCKPHASTTKDNVKFV